MSQKKKEVPTSKDIQKEKKILTSKDIGFFDPSLRYDFSELRLYYNMNIFVNQVSCD